MPDSTEHAYEVVDQACREVLGKPLSESTLGEIVSLAHTTTQQRSAAAVSVRDQVSACLRDTDECGCPISIPRLDAIHVDISRARPLHTCGKETTK